MNDAANEHPCNKVLCRFCFQFFWVYTRGRIAGSYGNSMFSILRNCHYFFPKWLYNFTFSPAMYKGSSFSTFLQSVIIICPSTIWKDYSSFHLTVLISLSKTDCKCEGLFVDSHFYLTDLYMRLLLLSVTSCLNYHSLVINEIGMWVSNLVLAFQDCFGYSGTLAFLYEF